MTTKTTLTRMPIEKCISFLMKMYAKFNPNSNKKEVRKEKVRLDSLVVSELNLELNEWELAVKGSAKIGNNDLNTNDKAKDEYNVSKASIEAIKPFKYGNIWYSYGAYCHKDVKLNTKQAKADKKAKAKVKAKAKATK